MHDVDVQTPDETLAGATSPGVPFLVIGHNRHIAWTFTTTGADVQDVFIETPTADGHEYLTPDGPRPFTTRIERIGVRGEPDEMLTVRSTRHGPVISDLGFGDDARGGVLAVAMANLGFQAVYAANVDQPGAKAGTVVSTKGRECSR